MRVSVESSIARHIGDRKEQQDRVAVLTNPAHPGALLVALADGMGGHSGGAMAAEQVIMAAKQNFDAFTPATEQPEQLLDAVVRDAHSSIRLTRFTSEQDPHSTVVVFALYRGKTYWAHCGDSRLYHFRGRELMSRTQDHSLVGELQRRGKLSAEEALRHPQRNVLIACLGGDRAPKAAHGDFADVTAGDHFLLCSDGLWNYFSDDELAATLDEHSAADAASLLLDQARERANGGGDNVSLAVVKFVAVEG
ncbi:MAG: protein phosphatase 2C domain-containing protein [Azoarcus sp.]|jgi:serine/threonine protein phosphatase PrpC|nr:protein phosphatase 2C domain-containing protein [Azoarcus sp.]